MKKLALPVLVAVLGVMVVWQYRQLRRLSPPGDYEYTFRTDIDGDYHDPRQVAAYYELGYGVGTFARETWRTHGIDVRHPDGDWALSRNAGLRYDHLRAVADTLGLRLARSSAWKKQGLDNEDIKAIEAGHMTGEQAIVRRYFGVLALRAGDKSSGVTKLQAKLLAMGYSIPQDGYYWVETEQAIADFQRKQNQPATGIADIATLLLLLTR